MVSKMRKATKSAEAMREMLNQNSEEEGGINQPPSQNQLDVSMEGLTSTVRLEVDDQFERLSQEIEVKISESLSHTLTQFENRLESAL